MENKEKRKNNWTRWFYWLIFAIVVIVVYRLFDNVSVISMGISRFFGILTPFILGIIIAYLFYAPCKGIEKLYRKVKLLKKPARTMSVFTVYIIAIVLIILLMNTVIPAISKSVVDLANNLPSYYNNTISYVDGLSEDSFINKQDIKNIVDKLQQIDIVKFFSLDNIISYIKGVMGVASAIFNIFVTIVMSIYILLERDKILNFIQRFNKAVFKNGVGEKLNKYIAKTNSIFLKFISTQILDGIIVGIIVSIVLMIMNVKYAVLLGFLIGLFNIIPYFGAIVAVAISCLITIFTGGFSQAIWMLVIVVIIQQLDANILNPKIVGNALKISPILIIFSVTVGGAYFGVLGMFLAVPIIAIIKILVDDYVEYKVKQKEENTKLKN